MNKMIDNINVARLPQLNDMTDNYQPQRIHSKDSYEFSKQASDQNQQSKMLLKNLSTNTMMQPSSNASNPYLQMLQEDRSRQLNI